MRQGSHLTLQGRVLMLKYLNIFNTIACLNSSQDLYWYGTFRFKPLYDLYRWGIFDTWRHRVHFLPAFAGEKPAGKASKKSFRRLKRPSAFFCRGLRAKKGQRLFFAG